MALCGLGKETHPYGTLLFKIKRFIVSGDHGRKQLRFVVNGRIYLHKVDRALHMNGLTQSACCIHLYRRSESVVAINKRLKCLTQSRHIDG